MEFVVDDDDVRALGKKKCFMSFWVVPLNKTHTQKIHANHKKKKYDIWFGYTVYISTLFRLVRGPRIIFRNVLLINIFHSKRNRYLSNETRLIHKSCVAMHTRYTTILAGVPIFLMHDFFSVWVRCTSVLALCVGKHQTIRSDSCAS